MKKFYLFMLMAVGLLISGNAGAVERTAGTADELTAAVSAASTGDVIKLTAPITLAANCTIPKNLTLNLNEQTISGKGYLYITSSEFSIVGNGSISSTGSYTMYMHNAIELTIGNDGDNIVLGDGKRVYFKTQNSTLNYNSTNPLKNMYCKDLAVNVGAKGVVNWSAGTMYGAVTVTNNNSFETSLGSSNALSIDNKVGATAKISGGTYSSAVTITNSGTFEITSGSFYDAAYQNVKDFIASGYKWIDALDGSLLCKKVVEESYVEPAVASYGGNTYASFAIAVAAAEQNTADQAPAITLLQEETISVALTFKKNYTIDLGGKELNTNKGVTVNNGTSFVLKNGKLTINNAQGLYISSSTQNVLLDGVTIENTNTGSAYGIPEPSAVMLHKVQTITITANTTLTGKVFGLGATQNNLSDIGTIINHSANATIKICAEYNENYSYYGYTHYIENLINDGGSSAILSSGTIFPASNFANMAQFIEDGLEIIPRTLSSGLEIYEVGLEAIPVAMVGEKSYTSILTALAASTAENPATLLKPLDIGRPLNVAGDWWLDLNGYSLSVTNYGVLVQGNVTVMDNSEGHTGKLINNNGHRLFDVLQAGSSITIQNVTCETTTEYGIMYSEDYNYSVVLDGPYTHLNVPNGTAIGICGKTPTSTVTVRNGATITAQDFCIANLGTYTAMNTTMNVESGAQLTSTEGPAIYHPGGGYLNISGENTIISGAESGIEIRAGELNMTGGNVTCTGTTISCEPNGNGTTTKGAGISVAQHTTTQPIIVNIAGGVVSGPFALVQLNPQGNDEENYLKMKVNVTGGKFITTKSEGGSLLNGDGKFGTVTYDANAMLLSQNRRILVSGGYYKDYDPAPFVMPGYVSVLLADLKTKGIATAEDEQAIAEGYIYKVTRITEAGSTDESKTSGDWHVNADDIWNEGEPDKLTQVKISGQEIIVSTPATAYGIEISGTQAGNTKLTITETGRLMVDMGGITGTSPVTFDVQNGGQMAIAPSATPETEFQPEATVTLVADWARRKASADSKEQGDLVAEDLYWQHIATPLSNGIAPTPSETGVSYVNTWNLVNGWTSATWANVVTPFVGYQISSIKSSGDEKIALTFKGKLVGNHVDPMTFTRIGFSFFGNSYLAPIDIRELLTCLETKNVVDPTVLLYNSEAGYYSTINRASFYIPGMIAEIKPMQGFFVFAESAANVDFDYTKAVWNSFCAKAQSGVVVPTAPKMQENPFSAIACIDVQAESGAKDRVMLFEGDELSAAEDKGYDAHKMITSGLNLYAKGSYADLAILATNNLLGSELVLKTDANTNYTLSFANIKGEYALYDALTGRTINMVEGATYEFNAQANATITDRFFVVEAAKAPTTVENIDAQAGSCKFMKNGIMFIERNNKVYNAQGQIVK